MLAHNISNLENCTGFRNTPPFASDEGQNLQDVYPFESEFGGPGKFGFDPRSHLTESSPLLKPETINRLREAWHSYWSREATIFVEKTPGNLLMTRFLQAAFPNSYFIVIRRHPIPVSLGTPKLGQATASSLHRLFAHWLHCHDLFAQDKSHLKRLFELTYEEYISDPHRYHQQIARFIGTSAPDQAVRPVKGGRSNRYFEEWQRLLTKSAFKQYYRYLAAKYEPGFAKYGYSLLLEPAVASNQVARSDALGRWYCRGADAYAFLLRVINWPSPNARRQIKAMLPPRLVEKISESRRLRHSKFEQKAKPDPAIAASQDSKVSASGEIPYS